MKIKGYTIAKRNQLRKEKGRKKDFPRFPATKRE